MQHVENIQSEIIATTKIKPDTKLGGEEKAYFSLSTGMKSDPSGIKHYLQKP